MEIWVHMEEYTREEECWKGRTDRRNMISGVIVSPYILNVVSIYDPCRVGFFIIHCVMVLLLFVYIHMLCFVLIWLCEPVCISK